MTLAFIIQQHVEDASFQWLLRNRAVHEPHYNIFDLARLDWRIEAHLDGLRISGDEGWKISRDICLVEEIESVFTAVVFALESGNEMDIKKALETGIIDTALFQGFISALGWLAYSRVKEFLQVYLNSDTPVERYISTATFAVHRKAPNNDLHEGLSSKNSALKARALKAIGELGKTDLAAALQDHFSEDDEKCRFYAGWSSGLLGSLSGVPVLQAIAQTQGPDAERACIAALRRMPPAEGVEWQRSLAAKGDRLRMAVVGAGASGDPVLVPWLIDYMAVPELARVAGESFSMITGVDLAYEDLEGEWPEGFEAGPTEDPEDEDVAMDPDEDLPWPEPALIREWWHKNKSNFKTGVRHLCGKPISEPQCQHVLRYGYQRQRAAAAMELAMLRPGQPLFNVEAPGWRQQKLLGLKSYP